MYKRQEQEKAGELYKKATGNFTEETIAPVAMAAALLAPSSFAAPVISPFALSSLETNVKKEGIKGVGSTAKEFVPGYGLYQFFSQKDIGKYAKEQPSAFIVDAFRCV